MCLKVIIFVYWILDGLFGNLSVICGFLLDVLIIIVLLEIVFIIILIYVLFFLELLVDFIFVVNIIENIYVILFLSMINVSYDFFIMELV